MRTPFDGVSRDAVSRDAALATSGGAHYVNPVKLTAPHWENQPPVRKPALKGPNILDLTGIQFGRFTVIGMSVDAVKRWVCRCTCGDFEVRTARAIRNPQNFGDRCHKCRNVAFEKKAYILDKTGREEDARKL